MQISRPKSNFQLSNGSFIRTLSLFAFIGIFYTSYAQINTVPYQFLTDTAGSLSVDRNGNTVDLSTEPYLIGTNQQNVNSPVTQLPFSVLFMGNNLSYFMVNSNGCVVLAPASGIAFTAGQANNFQLVNSTYTVLAPFWSSLTTPSNFGIRYKTTGIAPYRCLVVEWYTLAPAGSSTGSYDQQFQARFYETTNIIEYVYGQMRTGGNNPVKATIGFSTSSAATDSSFIALKNLDTFSITRARADLPAAQSLVNSSDTGVIKGLHSTTEGYRRRIAFVPTPITVPSNLTAFNISQNQALLYWDDNSLDEIGFTVYKIDNGNFIADTTVAPNISFRQLTGLLAGTTYQYKVRVYNNYTASYSNLAIFNTADANILTARFSGYWSDTTTWHGVIPSINDSVTIPSGITVVMDAANGVCHQLMVNGILEYADNAAAKKLSVNYNLVNNGRVSANHSPSFNGTHELSIGRHLVNNQVLDLYNASGAYTSAVSLTFNGTQSSVFSGSGDTTNLFNLSLLKNDLSDSLTIQPDTFQIKNANTDLLSGSSLLTNANHKGTLRINGTFAMDNHLFATNTVGASGSFTVCIDNPNYTLNCAPGDLTLLSGASLKLMRGSVNVQGSLLLNTSGFNVEGGLFNIAGQLKNASVSLPATVTQTNGKLITTGVILNAASNIITFTGGDLVINGNSTLLADINKSFFGGTKVQFGSPASPVRLFTANGYYPHLVIDTTISNGSIAKLTLNGSTSVYGNTRLSAEDTIDLAGNALNVFGDSLNINGTLKGNIPNSKLSFQANPSQRITGSGTIATDIFETDKFDTTYKVSLQLSNPILANAVLMSGGKVNHASSLIIGNGTGNALLKYGKSNNKQQGAYFDEAPVFNIGTGNYSVYYLHESQPRSTGFEIPTGRKIAGLFFSNKKGITVTGGTIEVYDTLRLDSGIITTTTGNEIILTDTSNNLALTGGSNNAYFNGPFSRRIPSQVQSGKSYAFPVGDLTYKPFVITNPVTTSIVDLRIAAFNATPSGTLGNTLQNIDTTGYWYVQLANGTSGLSSYKARIYNTRLNAFTRIAFAATSSILPSSADVFQSAGKRIAYNIDTIESITLTALNTTTPVNIFAQGHSIPDTLYEGTYTIGTGGDYLNLNTAAEALNSSYIDGPLVFEIIQSYDLQNEKFPVGFEQSIYTESPSSKKVIIKLAKNVTGIVTANDFSTLSSTNALIDLSGVDSLSFDGMGYDALGLPTGNIEWTARTSLTSTNVPVFRFVNDARANNLQSLRITGNNNSALSGTILFAGAPKGQIGNSYNTVHGCTITSASTVNLSYNHIYSKGESALIRNAHNEISNNMISDASGREIEIGNIGNGGYWKISGNSFFQTTASANPVIPVSFIAGQGSSNNEISWNVIGGSAAGASGTAWNYSGTGIFTAMQIAADSAIPSVISNNTIKNFNISSNVTTAAFRAIYASAGQTSILSNTVDAITIVGRGASNMIQVSVSNASSEVNDNQLSNIAQITGASTTTRLRGILYDGAGNIRMSNNRMFSLSSVGTGTDYRDASMVGIYITGSGQQVNMSNNKMWNLISASTGCVTGISVNSNASGTINGNNIYNLTNASGTVIRYIMGMNVENGTWKIYNNKISLSNTGNEVRSIVIAGIRISSPSVQPTELYYNTIHIGGTTSGASTFAISYCYYQLSSTYTVLKNNIFVNTRAAAAIHWAVYSSGGNWINTKSDFNVYYSANPASVVSINGSSGVPPQSFFSTTAGDQNSLFNVLPVFKNIPADISLYDTIANCGFNGIAVPVAQITDDYNGSTRNTTHPDPGAEEFGYTQPLLPLPVFLSGNDTLCAGSSRTLLMSNPPAGTDIEWFAQANGGQVLFTGRDFTTGILNSDTVFYAHVKSGSCKSYRVAIPVKTKPAADIQITSIPSDTVCAGDSHLLSVWSSEGTDVNWFADSTGGTLLHNGNTFTTGILNNDTAFYVEGSNGICPSVRKKISIYVDSATTLLLPVTDTLVKVCSNGTVILKAQSTDQINWYTQPMAGNPVVSDSLFTFTGLQSDTILYVSAAHNSCESERVKVQVKVYTTPVLPQIESSLTVCYNQPVSITASPASGELTWYTDSISTEPVFKGNTFTSAALENDTVFYYSIENGPCAGSDRKAVVINVHKVDAPVVDPVASICPGRSLILTVNNTGSYTTKWYSSAASTNPVFSGFVFVTGALTIDTVFYTELFDGTCSSERIPVAIDIVESAAAPQIVSVDSVCKGSIANITVASGAADIKWYTSLNSTEVLNTGTTFTTTPLANDTLFYVSSTYGSCVSNRIPVAVILKTSPQPPIIDPLEVACGGQSAKLTATASDSVKWYSNATSTNPLARGNVFNTPVLNASFTYYVLNDNGSCTSNRIPFTVTVTPAPQAPVVSDPNFRTCYNEPVTLKATGNGAINWYTTANSTIALQNDSVFTTDRLIRDTVFYAETVNGTCSSPRTPVAVSVLDYLGSSKIVVPDSAIIGSDISISTQGGPQASIYSWNFGAGSSVSSATGIGPYTLHYNTPGQKLISLSISKKSGNLTCDTTISVRLNVVDTIRVGLTEINPYLSFTLYPNPAKDLLHIAFDLKKAAAVTLELIDVTGRTVWEDQVLHSGTYQQNIDVSGFGKGLFILRTRSEGFVQNKKIIIE